MKKFIELMFEETKKETDTNTPEFKKWFGNSKVTDSGGKPLIVHHYTSEKFDVFDKDKIGDTNKSTVLDGFFFADNIPTSKWNDMEVYLKISNPIIINMEESVFDSVGVQEAIQHFLINGTDKYLREYLMSWQNKTNEETNMILNKWKNADGVILNNIEYDVHNIEYVVFKPTQIKSIYNNGDWDDSNPNIYE